MKYCTKCGKELVDEAVVCVHCGCNVANGGKAVDANDAPSTGFAILGFLIPLVGLILYLVNKDTAPKKAKSAGKGAIIGVCVSVAISIIYGAIAGAVIGSLGSMYY